MKIEITGTKILVFSILSVILRAIYVWCIMGYIWCVAGSACVYTGAHYYSANAGLMKDRCAGNYVHNLVDLTGWTPHSMANDDEAYIACQDLLKSKQDGMIKSIKAKTK